jgi:hypothetical protein
LEHNNCEKELQRKTEEVEILRTENKGLKELSKLEKLVADDSEDIPANEAGTRGSSLEGERLLQMKRSGFKRKSPQNEPLQQAKPSVRPTAKSKEKEYNCYECDFQGARELELNKHVNMKHRKSGNLKDIIKCYHCDNQFSTKWNLMSHRKSVHSDIVAICKNYKEGKCQYADEMCWWSHLSSLTKEQNFKCYVCEETFETKVLMMIHRKKDHTEALKICNNFISNTCRFKSEACWFRHEEDDNKENSQEVIDDEKDNLNDDVEMSESVFQKVSMNLKPPYQKHEN